MAKKSRKPRKYEDWSDEEWRDWGEKFGKRMGRRGKDFGEEMGELGERFGRHMERRGREWRREWKDWWFTTFGFVGPLIGSIFGLICLAVGIFILKFINLFLGSSFILAVSTFFFGYIHWFFAFFLFSGYTDYFSKRYRETFWTVSPLTTAIRICIAFWIAAWVLNLINTVPKISAFTSISNFLFANLLGIFVLLVFIGYVVMMIKKLIMAILRY